jgi:DNA invertase Pin-like site-specific DNA recombinase
MTKNDPRPLVPYLRQSRARERTISIDEQRRDIRRWVAADGGASLAAELVEQNVSGSKPWRDRALGEAVAMCERGEASGIVVAWQDRLSRENQRATAEVWEALDKAGARLVCAAEGLDTATGDQEMLFTIKAAIARDQWKRYRANWQRAQRSANDRGVPNGRAPVGYRKTRGRSLNIDKRGAAKVVDAMERRAAGESFSSIGRRHGWSHSTTRQIIENDMYLGIVRCGNLARENAHPPIVSRELFEAANAARTKQPVPPGETTRDRLLLGIARCAGCGHTLKQVRRPRVDGTFAVSYYCKDAATSPCPERAFVHCEQLDSFVADWFRDALRTTPRMVDVIAAERELEQAQRERDKADAELTKFVETASALEPVLFRRGIAARQKRLDDARANVQAASARTTRLPVGGSLIELWDGFTPRERRGVLAGFLDRIDVRLGASSDLAGNVRIVWTDGTVAHKEKRVRMAAA